MQTIRRCTVKMPNGECSFRTKTMVDPATDWFKIEVTKNLTSEETQHNIDSHWLGRHPRPQECRFDNDSEFKWLLKEPCKNHGSKGKLTTDHNLQANSMIEHSHWVLGNEQGHLK